VYPCSYKSSRDSARRGSAADLGCRLATRQATRPCFGSAACASRSAVACPIRAGSAHAPAAVLATSWLTIASKTEVRGAAAWLRIIAAAEATAVLAGRTICRASASAAARSGQSASSPPRPRFLSVFPAPQPRPTSPAMMSRGVASLVPPSAPGCAEGAHPSIDGRYPRRWARSDPKQPIGGAPKSVLTGPA
jgi:hypothetical protein